MTAFRGSTRTSLARILLAVVALVALAGCFPEPDPNVQLGGSPNPGARAIYWGAVIDSQLTGTAAPWDMNAVSTFEAQSGKPLSLVSFAAPFANCYGPCSFYKFDANAFSNVRNHGAIPFFSWASQSLPSSLNEPDFQLADVTAGKFDGFLRDWATAAKAWGSPFFLRFNFEMNGNWFPWSEGVNGNQTGDYVAAWRHVHDIFTSVGATNANWVWCPNVDPHHMFTPLSTLYPGDDYVDWTCLDGYNWGSDSSQGEWLSFDDLYHTTYHEIVDQLAPGKPMIIGESASSETGGSKAAWITDMLGVQLPQHYDRIDGVVWTDSNVDGMDWPIDSSPAARSAFAAAVQNPVYAGNQFRSLAGPVIPSS